MFNFLARTRAESILTINGKTYRGNSIEVRDGCVYIDGKPAQDCKTHPKIEITVNGDVDTLEAGSGLVTVQGNARSIKSGSGNVHCGAVQGNVTSGSGDIQAGDVSGDVTTSSGDVSCGSVGGNVRSTSGDICHR